MCTYREGLKLRNPICTEWMTPYRRIQPKLDLLLQLQSVLLNHYLNILLLIILNNQPVIVALNKLYGRGKGHFYFMF